MAKDTKKKTVRPPRTPEERERLVIGEAMNLAEKQILDGTASPSVIVHFLKLGSSRERLEQEMLAKKTELAGAQIESLQSSQRLEELYVQAMEAMKIYSGNDA